MGALGALGGLLTILGIILAIVWIILPFAVLGIKPRLDQVIRLLTENRDVMIRLLNNANPESVETEDIAKISQNKNQWTCPNCGTINLYYKGSCSKCNQSKP